MKRKNIITLAAILMAALLLSLLPPGHCTGGIRREYGYLLL